MCVVVELIWGGVPFLWVAMKVRDGSEAAKPATDDPHGARGDCDRFTHPCAAPKRNETGEASRLDTPRHEASDVLTESRSAIRLEVGPAEQGSRHENGGHESDDQRDPEAVLPEEQCGEDGRRNVGGEFDRVDLVVQHALGAIHSVPATGQSRRARFRLFQYSDAPETCRKPVAQVRIGAFANEAMMRVLLSTIGSRGDVQPLVALALELRALGRDVRMCAPPDFKEWIEGLGIDVTPIGPELRKLTAASPASGSMLRDPERRRQLIEGTVRTQFETIAAAAQGCDLIVGATALQIAAPSVAEQMGIPYVFAAYCPTVLPSPRHAPIPLPGRTVASTDNRELWADDSERWNVTWGPPLNSQRAALGLSAIDDVRGYVLTSSPWLAADPTLAPWPTSPNDGVIQTGAWIVGDGRPLSHEIETFLDGGDPPVYFGFGSIRAAEGSSRAMIESARALGRRALVSRGWADLALIDDQPDCLAIGEVNQQALFKRVAAVVHHGGAGTTTAAALAGAPQVIIPQGYDQPYWAGRVQTLGIGTAHAFGATTTESLTSALESTISADVAMRARSVAGLVRLDGAALAARRLMSGRSRE